MSSWIITANLSIEYTENNISNILKVGIKQNLHFLKFLWKEYSYKCPPIDNLEDTVKSIMIGDDNNFHCINIKIQGIQDTFATLHFFNNAGKISLMLNNFFYPWIKKFAEQDYDDIDIQMYAKVILDLVQDYKILEMKIEKN